MASSHHTASSVTSHIISMTHTGSSCTCGETVPFAFPVVAVNVATAAELSAVRRSCMNNTSMLSPHVMLWPDEQHAMPDQIRAVL
jgi:hypothetical protein